MTVSIDRPRSLLAYSNPMPVHDLRVARGDL